MSVSPIRVLLLLVLALAAGLAWLWLDPQGQVRNATWVAPVAIPPDIKLPDSVSRGFMAENASLYAVIIERPLFAPDRRPPPPPAPPAPPPPPDPLADISIHGVFSGENVGILARIDGKGRRVKLGESIGSWTLKSVDGRDITFMQGEQSRKLRLAYARLSTPSPQPPPPVNMAGRAGAGPTGGTSAQRAQDETRDRIRRLNEERAKFGQPPINYP